MIWPPPEVPLEGSLVRLRMTLQTVACRRPRSLACRARHAPCVLGRLGFRAPGLVRPGWQKVVRCSPSGCMRVEPSRVTGSKTDARNERSRGAMEALPATFEGIFRKHMLMPVTGVRDSAYFSVVDDEWPSVRQNLEQRLAGAREVGSA